MKCLVKYMHMLEGDNIVVEAKWAPTFEKNETLTLSKYEFKINDVIDKDNKISYTINLIMPKYKIPEIIVDEDALLEEDSDLIDFIKKLIKCKKFELEFTQEVLDNIYKKSQ